MKYQNSHLHRILAMVKTCFRFYRAVGIKKTMAKSDTKKHCQNPPERALRLQLGYNVEADAETS
jgi:hypothetical protein